jgi:hypothetical protein
MLQPVVIFGMFYCLVGNKINRYCLLCYHGTEFCFGFHDAQSYFLSWRMYRFLMHPKEIYAFMHYKSNMYTFALFHHDEWRDGMPCDGCALKNVWMLDMVFSFFTISLAKSPISKVIYFLHFYLESYHNRSPILMVVSVIKPCGIISAEHQVSRTYKNENAHLNPSSYAPARIFFFAKKNQNKKFWFFYDEHENVF